MDNPLERINDKLLLLKESDKDYQLFGASTHLYLRNNPLKERDIIDFENIHKIKLPIEFANFYTTISNGGAGPFYGLQPLHDTLYASLDYKDAGDLLDPSQPFTHSQAWNMKFPNESAITEYDEERWEEQQEEYSVKLNEFEKQYFDKRFINGALAICNYGCGATINLVVNGPEYGFLWMDDRGSDGGIFPYTESKNEKRMTFLNWYERWLDLSLEKIEFLAKNRLPKEPPTKKMTKPWWSFWS